MLVLECPPGIGSTPSTHTSPSAGRINSAASSRRTSSIGAVRVQRSRIALENHFDRILYVFGFGHRLEAVDHLAGLVDQELGEIPFDVPGAKDARLLALQIAVQRVSIRPVDLDLFEHRKTHAIVHLAE